MACAACRWGEAHTARNDALVLAKDIGDPTQLWRTHATLGAYHAQRAETHAARNAHRAARAVIDAMLAALPTPELRGSLEKLPAAQELTQKSLR